jgi:Flp pilus assembly protein TadD/O-antigen ligase
MPSDLRLFADSQRRLASRVGLALLVLSPLFFFRPLEDAYVLPQRLVALLGLILAFIGLQPQPFSRSRILWLALAFFAWRCFTQGAGLGEGLTLSWLVQQMVPLGTLLWVAHAARQAELSKRLWQVAALSLVLAAAYALIQLWGFDPWDQGAVDMGFLKRAHGSLGNPDFLAGFLILGLPALVLAWSQGSGFLGKRWLLAPVLLALVTLLLTHVRGAWLAAAVSLPVALYAGRQHWQWRPLGLLVLLGLGAAIFFSVPSRFNPSLESPWARLKGAWSGDGSWAGRRFMGRVGLDLANAHPLMGVGPGHFQDAYLEEQGRLLNQPGTSAEPYRFTADIHDDWLQCLAESGLPALGLLLSALFFALRGAWRHGGVQGASVVGLFTAFSIQAFLHFPFSVQASAIFFWGAVGLTAVWDEAAAQPSDVALPWAWLCLPFVLGLALTTRQGLASAALNTGTELRDVGRSQEAIPFFSRAARLWPEDARAWMRLGISQDLNGAEDDALESFERAAKVQPGLPEAWTNLGLVLGKLGRLPDAQAATEQALSLNPRSAEAWSNLAKMRYMQGDAGGAVRDIQSGLAQAGESPLLYFNLGVIHLNHGERAAAAEALRQCLRLDPQHPQAGPLLKSLEHAP